MNKLTFNFLLFMLIVFFVRSSFGQGFSSSINYPYRISPDVTFLTMGDWEFKADIYHRRDNDEPKPTLVLIHGYGVDGGSKNTGLFMILPYLEKGWNVVNLSPRLPGVTLLLAAIRNCQCALKWIQQNAEEYNFDADKLVISGPSGGALISIATAMSPRMEDWDRPCPGKMPKVAAVVSWYGAYDISSLMDGPNKKQYALDWVRNLPNQKDVAKSLSALPLEERGVPTIWIHGDKDAMAPYPQAVEFTDALKAKGIKSQLITVTDANHGGYSREKTKEIYESIWVFLAELGITSE